MSNESKALKLADELHGYGRNPMVIRDEAAAELRRQHAEIESLRAQLAARVPEPEHCEPSCLSYDLAAMVMSDCGHSTNNQLLLDRIAERIARHTDAMLSAAPSQQAPTNCRHCGGPDNVLCAGQCKQQAPLCATCNDNGLIGGPSYYAPDEGGAPCPDCSQPVPHPDDVAVDRFAEAMKQKLGLARAKGRDGWQTCSKEDLSRMLREHVEKGDPRDVANFCMFLYSCDAVESKEHP